MIFGSRAQKMALSVAAAFAVASTVYALILSILTWVSTGNWSIFAIWGATVSFYAPILTKLMRMTWYLIDRVS